MIKSIKKGPFIENYIIKQIYNKNKYIIIKNKSSYINNIFIKYFIYIYNGKYFLHFKVLFNIVNYYFGSFILTKKFNNFKIK